MGARNNWMEKKERDPLSPVSRKKKEGEGKKKKRRSSPSSSPKYAREERGRRKGTSILERRKRSSTTRSSLCGRKKGEVRGVERGGRKKRGLFSLEGKVNSVQREDPGKKEKITL